MWKIEEKPSAGTRKNFIEIIKLYLTLTNITKKGYTRVYGTEERIDVSPLREL